MRRSQPTDVAKYRNAIDSIKAALCHLQHFAATLPAPDETPCGASGIANQHHHPGDETMRYEVIRKGFSHHGSCVCCGGETQSRDKKDGYLVKSEDGSFGVLCRWCNSHVHSTGSSDAYAIDASGSFCRTGESIDSPAVARKQFTATTSESGTQPEDLADGSAFI